MNTPVVELRGICKSFSGNKVLDNIDLAMHAGEILCLVGENGSGKSTLIKIISGVYEADNGEVVLNGRQYHKLIPTDSIREGVQVIYQDFSIFPNLTVAENISLGTQLFENKKIVNWKRIREEAKRSLNMIDVEIGIDEEVGRLSIAQRQIVAISRAILQNAKLIIMDEPTTALTRKEIARLYDIIKGLSQRGISVIFVSHKLDEVFAVCQRIAVMRNGKMIVDESVNDFQKEKLVYYMTGQEIEERPFEYKPISDQSILKVKNLSAKAYFENVSFELYPGEILGITGQLGSGRTELAKALFGIQKVDSGEIMVNDQAVLFEGIKDALKHRIAYVPEDRLTEGLFMNRSVTDNINATIVDKMTKSGNLLAVESMEAEAEKRIKELSVNAPSIDVDAGTFSGGNQQRIVIGKWLASEPQILILNGPTVGVDVKSKSEIHKIIKELALKGIAIILISDDIGELLSTTNRVFILNDGKMIYETPTNQTSHEVLSQKITQSMEINTIS